jgi:hypothetical protein
MNSGLYSVDEGMAASAVAALQSAPGGAMMVSEWILRARLPDDFMWGNIETRFWRVRRLIEDARLKDDNAQLVAPPVSGWYNIDGFRDVAGRGSDLFLVSHSQAALDECVERMRADGARPHKLLAKALEQQLRVSALDLAALCGCVCACAFAMS